MSYTAVVTPLTRKVTKLSDEAMAMLAGTCNLSVYAAAKVAITAISGYFKGTPIVLCESVSSLGYLVRWDSASKAFKAFYPTIAATFTGSALAAHTHTLHFQTSAAANAVTAAANSLRTPAAAFDVAGVANNSGEGGIVQVSAGTPAGTITAGAATEVADGTNVGIIQFMAMGVAP
jgi:hypothetical protein